MGETDLSDIEYQVRKLRPLFPAAGFRVVVAYSKGDEFVCKEFPVIGWRVCDENDQLCLHVVSGNPPEVNCVCEISQKTNVFAARVVYPGAEVDVEQWREKQRANWESEKEVGS